MIECACYPRSSTSTWLPSFGLVTAEKREEAPAQELQGLGAQIREARSSCMARDEKSSNGFNVQFPSKE